MKSRNYTPNGAGGIFAAAISIVVGIVVLSFLLSYPLMLIWNGCLVPAVTVVNEVSWMQMWGLGFLFGSLFKTQVPSGDKNS